MLRAWRDADSKTCHYIIPERIGELTFEASFISNQIDGTQRQSQSQHNFNPEYRRLIVTRIQAYFLTRGAIRQGQLPGDPSELESLISTVLPDFELTLHATANPPYQLLRVADRKKVPNIHELSSGEAQVLTVALDILTIAAMWEIEGNVKRLVLIDEPDAHIHPDLQVRFSDFLVRVAERFKLQVVIATHSTTLLAALGQFGSEDASVIYLDRTKSEFTTTAFNKQAKELAACLGGHALMGPLFGVPILLVEGDDDYRIWSQVPRHHVTSFSVIPTNGDEIKQYQKALETILGALREPGNPAGFALLDGDKSLTEANPQCPQNHIRYIRFGCHEAENLYLTDEVLSLIGIKWDAATAAILANAHQFGQKSAFLASATGWDRRNVDIHDVINELTKILDSKNVHWTIRVARAIGEKRPSGQLHEFLGANVVNALWGGQVQAAQVAAE